MKRLKVMKIPKETEVLLVTKKEIEELKEKHPSISMGNHDKNYLKDFSDNEIVGVVAGEIDNMETNNADLWFINKGFFDENYAIIK